MSEKYSIPEAKYTPHGDGKFPHTDAKYLATYAAGSKSGAPSTHIYGAQHTQPGDYSELFFVLFFCLRKELRTQNTSF